MTALVSAGCCLNPAWAQFSPATVPGLPPLHGAALALGDYDGDGRLDILLSGRNETIAAFTLSIWRNTGSGFADVTAAVAPGLPGAGNGSVAWGDYDNDGRLDFLVTGLTNVLSHDGIAQVWHNTGSGFTHVPVPGLPGVSQSSVAWSDFDNDGRLDFLITGTTNENLSGMIAQLWRNTGQGFTNLPVPGLLGMAFGSAGWGDFDNDGRADFLVTGNNVASQLWRNTGEGFTNVAVAGLEAVFGSSVAWGDYNNDGLLDFLLQGFSMNGFICELFRNTGNGFSKVTIPGLPGVAEGSLAWADYDNDGQLDFLTAGSINLFEISQLWRNTGSTFTNVPIPGLAGSFDNSLAWGDYDNDRRLDFLIAGRTQAGDVSQLWRNTLPNANSPPAAPDGLSATVTGSAVVLRWNAPTDDHTPAAGLSYNVRIGTAPGGSDIAAAGALTNGTLLLPQMGTARHGSTIYHQLQPGRTFYWSVQAVDTGLAGSAFAAEQRFSTATVLSNPARQPDGAFQFDFTGMTGAVFSVVASTNLNATNWMVLGAANEIAPGHYQFIDAGAPARTQRFYGVRSP